MSQKERYGTRSLTYSAWHRKESLRRYIDPRTAHLLSQIDMDTILWVEYDNRTREPLALIEEARDIGQANKTTEVTRNLARRAGIPALTVLWTPADTPNPANKEWPDIKSFRVKRHWPPPEGKWHTLTPEEYIDYLMKVRTFPGKNFDRWVFGIRR